MSKQAQDALQSLKRYILADGFPIVLDLEQSQGVHFHNAYDERKYLDCFSFFASLPLGYNHPGFQKPEYQNALLRAAQIKISNPDIYTLDYIKFVETFAAIAGGAPFKHFFFIDGGALAVENALKTAFDWKVRKNIAKGRGEKGNKVIYFENAFHGRSGYTLTVTNTADPNKTKYFPKFDWFKVSTPFIEENQPNQDISALEQKSLNQILQVLERHEDDVACIIIEPIQGEGGDNHFRKEFLQSLRKICDQRDVLLIFDEVQTGIGLTGKMWAYEHFDVIPDIVSFGKKTQVCGLMTTGRIDDVDNVFKVSSRINSTFGGNLVDMVRCTRYLEIIQEENLCRHVEKTGEIFLKELKSLQKRYPQMTRVRGRGFFIAFDLPDTKTRNQFREDVWKNGALVLNSGSRSIRLRPSLNFGIKNVEEAILILEKAFQGLKP